MLGKMGLEQTRASMNEAFPSSANNARNLRGVSHRKNAAAAAMDFASTLNTQKPKVTKAPSPERVKEGTFETKDEKATITIDDKEIDVASENGAIDNVVPFILSLVNEIQQSNSQGTIIVPAAEGASNIAPITLANQQDFGQNILVKSAALVATQVLETANAQNLGADNNSDNTTAQIVSQSENTQNLMAELAKVNNGEAIAAPQISETAATQAANTKAPINAGTIPTTTNATISNAPTIGHGGNSHAHNGASNNGAGNNSSQNGNDGQSQNGQSQNSGAQASNLSPQSNILANVAPKGKSQPHVTETTKTGATEAKEITAANLEAASGTETAQLFEPAADQANPTGSVINLPAFAASVVRKFQNGDKSIFVRLDPAELGAVTVELKISAEKKVSAIITAENQEAMQDLTRNSKELVQSLKDAGLELSEGNIEFNLGFAGNEAHQSKQDANQSSKSKNQFLQNQNENPNEIEITQSSQNTNNIKNINSHREIWHRARVSLSA